MWYHPAGCEDCMSHSMNDPRLEIEWKSWKSWGCEMPIIMILLASNQPIRVQNYGHLTIDKFGLFVLIIISDRTKWFKLHPELNKIVFLLRFYNDTEKTLWMHFRIQIPGDFQSSENKWNFELQLTRILFTYNYRTLYFHNWSFSAVNSFSL